uniref:Uncharacterized protein n=1 Tax=Heterorhabditis bacteriophora TaxID=37862 RepID=A0A1I7X5H9_HETBA
MNIETDHVFALSANTLFTGHRYSGNLCEGIFTCQVKHSATFSQLFSHTNSYFGRQLLRSQPSDEFGNKEEAETERTSWQRTGTDPALPFPLRMTYTTRPSHFIFCGVDKR